jgi:hypothetical protein
MLLTHKTLLHLPAAASNKYRSFLHLKTGTEFFEKPALLALIFLIYFTIERRWLNETMDESRTSDSTGNYPGGAPYEYGVLHHGKNLNPAVLRFVS